MSLAMDQTGLPHIDPHVDDAMLRRIWSTPPGLLGSLSAVNNQVIGRRFMVTALLFFGIGGILALLIRVQLAVPDNRFLGPQVYNEVFTMHGSTMMYLFAVPFLEGLAVYLLPMLVGSRDLAFPRLTAFGYWMYLFGGLVFYASFAFAHVPDVGWFAYTPLSEARYSGLGTDFWLLGLSLVELSGITAGIEIVITVLKMRAPGMTLGRMPLLAWAFLTAGVMILFAFTTLLTATVLLEMDRSSLATRFFDPTFGGNPLLWQHLFWFFGHPEVYIIFLPATGIVSMVVAAFARRFVGYVMVVVAIVLTGFISFGLWVHHMYTTGLPALSMSFFAAASLMIALASGVQVFAWIASLWGSRAAFKTPLLFVLGFLFIFVLGGLTGVMIAVVPFDWQVHDTYFIVAHFHYVLIGGAVFPVFAGLHFWLPKITGRMLSEALGRSSFWLTFIGFNVTFFPMHQMGFEGMPRRVYTYPTGLGLGWMNLLATIGAFVLAAGFGLFLVNVIRSLWRGSGAPANPWEADSLEWSVSSPPPVYTFYRPPVVLGRHPLWVPADDRPDRHTPAQQACERAASALAGGPTAWRATLGTDVLTAMPQTVHHLPGPSIVPLVVSLGLVIAAIGVLVKAYLLGLTGALFAGVAIVAWLRPRHETRRMLRDSELADRAGVTALPHGTLSLAWWGMVALIATLATVLATLLYAYFYLRLYATQWPQGDLPIPGWLLPAIACAALIAAAGGQWWAMRGFTARRQDVIQLGAAAAAGGGLLYLALHTWALVRLDYAPGVNAFASLVYTLNWGAMLFALLGVILSAVLLIEVTRQAEAPEDLDLMVVQVQVTTLYWYFLAATAAAVFLTVYVSPHVL